MGTVADIDLVVVSLKVGAAQSPALFILLARDGTVNRLGTGAVDNTERDLFIGRTTEPLFPALMNQFTDAMLQHVGGYEMRDRKGEDCRLSIALRFADGSEDGFGFLYGSESEGPPQEIVQIVIEAARLTDPWYEAQKKTASAGKK